MKKWIKKNDKVVVIAGNDKGRTGAVLAKNGDKVIIQGINVRKRHVKKNQKGSAQIIEMEKGIHISNISFCDDDGKAIKIKVRKKEKGEKELYYLSDGKEKVLRTVGKQG